MTGTRLFFVVDSIDDNEEIFETLEHAEKHFDTLSPVRVADEAGEDNNRRIRICLVRNAYRQPEDSRWNYDGLRPPLSARRSGSRPSD
jgi:hypothetical protein